MDDYECYGCAGIFDRHDGYECLNCDWFVCRTCCKGEFGKSSTCDEPSGHDWESATGVSV